MTAHLENLRAAGKGGPKQQLRALSRQLRPENRARLARLPVARLELAREARRLERRRSLQAVIGTARLPSISVINLASRPDRLSEFTAEARSLGLENVHRVEAVQSENGFLGCASSHAICLERMLAESWPAMMVCEDDATFRIGRRDLDALVESFLNDDEAEVACLAYFHRQAEPHNRLFLRSRDAQTTACYVVKASIAAALLDNFRQAIEELANGGSPAVHAPDQTWKAVQRSRTFLIPIVRAVGQRPGYSDILKSSVDYLI